jgi:ribosome-binding factor A
MRRELAEILDRKLRDPRLATMFDVTDVQVTADLSFARVFVAVHGNEEDRARVMEGLGRAAGFVRRELGPRLGLREVPEIRFEYDDSLDRGARVDELLRRLESGQPIEDDDPA